MVKNCQLESVLSYGSEGTVYSGIWRRTRAAIKVLNNQYARRAENEVKLIKILDHSNIIKYYDLEYEQGTAYLVMEFITGGNLYEFIQTKFTSTSYWSTIEQILHDIARGMMYLHDHRIVQGDLKSHNILLREGTHQAVICDFGIARCLDNDNQEKKRTNTTKGTIRWMAPELCSPPPEPSSFSSDVWSYGCIILETTSAREPWIDQFNDDSLLFRALQRKENASIFAHLCTTQSGPSHLRQLLIQCCAWSKTDRPTFTDILRKLNGDEDGNASIDEYVDCMSVESTLATEPSFLEKNDGNDASTHDGSKKIQSPNNLHKSNTHGGRLTGEVYTSRGMASGRPIYEGSKGGRYYLTPSGSKVYLHK
ncbi:unnamed protein product [Rotaria sordida]|uniref:Protein kinase domain-containing protein n=1 Tax=Rotaria sordida TaxID=392033 RepID=A0A815LKC3_9BILA|nr:unnamed protein product [Rotaria sordida]